MEKEKQSRINIKLPNSPDFVAIYVLLGLIFFGAIGGLTVRLFTPLSSEVLYILVSLFFFALGVILIGFGSTLLEDPKSRVGAQIAISLGVFSLIPFVSYFGLFGWNYLIKK